MQFFPIPNPFSPPPFAHAGQSLGLSVELKKQSRQNICMAGLQNCSPRKKGHPPIFSQYRRQKGYKTEHQLCYLSVIREKPNKHSPGGQNLSFNDKGAEVSACVLEVTGTIKK